MRELIVFYHVAVLGTWQHSDKIIQDHLYKYGLYENASKVYYCVSGDYNEATQYFNPYNHPKSIFMHLDHEPKSEIPTLNYMVDYCQYANCDILYIHTKGASSHYRSDGVRVNGLYTGWWSDTDKWLSFLMYSLTSRHQDAIKKLQEYDVVGPMWRQGPFYHYSGNFFIAKCEHIRKLRKLDYYKANFNTADYKGRYEEGNMAVHQPRFRHEAELWIGSLPDAKYFNLAEIDPHQNKCIFNEEL